jgi:hypothetical protein
LLFYYCIVRIFEKDSYFFFAFRLEGAVVYGLGLLDLTVRPGADHLRRSQSDLDRIELLDRSVGLEKLQKVFHRMFSSRRAVISPAPAPY